MALTLSDLNMTRRERRQAIQRIQKGIDHIRAEGWCQGEFHSTEGEACAMGAIGVRNSGHVSRQAAHAAQLIEHGIRKVQPKARLKRSVWEGAPDVVISWNDRRGRTKGQVLKAFRAAIKIGERLS